MGSPSGLARFAIIGLASASALAGCGQRAPSPDAANEPSIPLATVPAARPMTGKSYQNSLGMKFVSIPGTASLFSVWETRVQDYEAFLKSAGVAFTPAPERARFPINNVSWDEAASFCEWLTNQERKAGRIGPKDRYRLPRDREWDAAMGSDRYPWGNKWPKLNERVNLPGYLPNNQNLLAPVGSTPPNRFGIYDLGGNVLEWCHDSYARELNPSEIRVEYKRLDDDGGGNKFKVLRGNSWLFFDPMNLLCSYRYMNKPDARGTLYGFRCVLEFNSPMLPRPVKQPKPPAAPPALTPQMVSGRDVYLGKCGECHQYFDPASYNVSVTCSTPYTTTS